MTDCPFRLCSANVIMVVEQAQSGDDELTLQRVPLHQLDNVEAPRVGTCPASLLIAPLDDYAREQLQTMDSQIDRLIESQRVERPSVASEPAPAPQPAGSKRWFTQGGRGGPADGCSGYPRLHLVPQPTTEPNSGGTVSDSMRDQLRALTLLAIEGWGQAQEIVAGLTASLEATESQITALREKQDTTHTIALSAVGGSDMPDAAASMVGNSSTAIGMIDEVRATLQLAVEKLAEIHQSDTAAVTDAERLVAAISS